MMYLLETRERCVYVFGSERDAVAHAKGVDVEAGIWRFFDAGGAPLVAVFQGPHGQPASASGTYLLEPAPADVLRLQDILHEVRTGVVHGKLVSVAMLRELLAGAAAP